MLDDNNRRGEGSRGLLQMGVPPFLPHIDHPFYHLCPLIFRSLGPYFHSGTEPRARNLNHASEAKFHLDLPHYPAYQQRNVSYHCLKYCHCREHAAVSLHGVLPCPGKVLRYVAIVAALKQGTRQELGTWSKREKGGEGKCEKRRVYGSLSLPISSRVECDSDSVRRLAPNVLPQPYLRMAAHIMLEKHSYGVNIRVEKAA